MKSEYKLTRHELDLDGEALPVDPGCNWIHVTEKLLVGHDRVHVLILWRREPHPDFCVCSCCDERKAQGLPP